MTYMLNFWRWHAIFIVGIVPLPGISLQDFKNAVIFWQNVEESWRFQKIYMMLERLTLRQNGQVGSKKHKFNGKCFTPTHFVLMFLYSLHSGMMVSNLHKQVYNDLYFQVGLTFKSNPSISKFNFICQVYVHVLPLEGLWCFTPLSTRFQLYCGGKYWWRTSPTCHKPLTNFLSHNIVWVHLCMREFELAPLVVVAIGFYKSNYPTTTMTPVDD